jgi:hypothetical protein
MILNSVVKGLKQYESSSFMIAIDILEWESNRSSDGQYQKSCIYQIVIVEQNNNDNLE